MTARPAVLHSQVFANKNGPGAAGNSPEPGPREVVTLTPVMVAHGPLSISRWRAFLNGKRHPYTVYRNCTGTVGTPEGNRNAPASCRGGFRDCVMVGGTGLEPVTSCV